MVGVAFGLVNGAVVTTPSLAWDIPLIPHCARYCPAQTAAVKGFAENGGFRGGGPVDTTHNSLSGPCLP